MCLDVQSNVKALKYALKHPVSFSDTPVSHERVMHLYQPDKFKVKPICCTCVPISLAKSSNVNFGASLMVKNALLYVVETFQAQDGASKQDGVVLRHTV